MLVYVGQLFPVNRGDKQLVLWSITDFQWAGHEAALACNSQHLSVGLLG